MGPWDSKVVQNPGSARVKRLPRLVAHMKDIEPVRSPTLPFWCFTDRLGGTNICGMKIQCGIPCTVRPDHTLVMLSYPKFPSDSSKVVRSGGDSILTQGLKF